MNLIRKSWAQEAQKLTFKAADEGSPGAFEGYGAVFGNVDRDTEIIAKGAFSESLAAFVRDGFIACAHEWDEGIATVDDAFEDDYGLYIKCTFHSDDESQATRTKTMERLDRGKSVGLSVGFMPLEWSWDAEGQVRTITKAELYEVSIVTVPANPMAQVVAAKSVGTFPTTVREFEKFLRDAGCSKARAVAIASKGFDAGLRDAAPEDSTDTPDSEAIALEQDFLLSEARLLGVAA